MKKFLNYSGESENLKLIECKNLNNDLLFIKYDVSEDEIIKLNENQNIALVEEGKVTDLKKEQGLYSIKETNSKEIDENLSIRKAENEKLCVLFINTSEIKHSKYFMNDPIKYLDWRNGFSREIFVKLEGYYDFKIENSLNFLSKIIGIRNYFSKQELIEKVRKYVIKSIEEGINELSLEYKLDIDSLVLKSKELEIKLKQNEYDKKLLEYGIKILYFDIKKFEITKKKFKFF